METILSKAMEARVVDDAVIAESLEHRKAFWHLRDHITASQKPEGGSIKHDVSVPVASVPAFIAEASAAVTKLVPGARPFPFGHLGDGNIHFNISQPIGADKNGFLARWHEVSEVVHGVVMRYSGSISAEHGIGVMKRDELAGVKDKVAMQLMRQVKATLDPNGILNPGKVL
jgi:D-lactate dehydrogenase (cytochrome)